MGLRIFINLLYDLVILFSMSVCYFVLPIFGCLVIKAETLVEN